MPKRKDEEEPRMVGEGTTVVAPKPDYYPDKTQAQEKRAKDRRNVEDEERKRLYGQGTYRF